MSDRQVGEKHIYHGIDRADPRANIRVEALTAQQIELTLAYASGELSDSAKH